MMTEAERVRARIAQELRVALKGRNASRVAALRSLAAALEKEIEVLEQYVRELDCLFKGQART